MTNHGDYFQRTWSDSEQQLHINFLEIRAAQEGARELAEDGDAVQLYIDNTSACAYIRKLGGTRSTLLMQESMELWRECLARNITILPPRWLASEENFQADFLSRHSLVSWNFQLSAQLFSRVCRQFRLKPTLDAFATRETAQIPRYMTWERDAVSVGQDALIQTWDDVTWLFPPFPLLPVVLREVEEQQIEAILICPRWEAAMWWQQLRKLLQQPFCRLPASRECLSYPGDPSKEIPFKVDLLIAVFINSK